MNASVGDLIEALHDDLSETVAELLHHPLTGRLVGINEAVRFEHFEVFGYHNINRVLLKLLFVHVYSGTSGNHTLHRRHRVHLGKVYREILFVVRDVVLGL